MTVNLLLRRFCLYTRGVMIVVAAFLVADIARQRYLLRTGRYKKFDDDHYV